MLQQPLRDQYFTKKENGQIFERHESRNFKHEYKDQKKMEAKSFELNKKLGTIA